MLQIPKACLWGFLVSQCLLRESPPAGGGGAPPDPLGHGLAHLNFSAVTMEE